MFSRKASAQPANLDKEPVMTVERMSLDGDWTLLPDHVKMQLIRKLTTVADQLKKAYQEFGDILNLKRINENFENILQWLATTLEHPSLPGRVVESDPERVQALKQKGPASMRRIMNGGAVPGRSAKEVQDAQDAQDAQDDQEKPRTKKKKDCLDFTAAEHEAHLMVDMSAVCYHCYKQERDAARQARRGSGSSFLRFWDSLKRTSF